MRAGRSGIGALPPIAPVFAVRWKFPAENFGGDSYHVPWSHLSDAGFYIVVTSLTHAIYTILPSSLGPGNGPSGGSSTSENSDETLRVVAGSSCLPISFFGYGNGAGAELSAEFPGQLAVHRSRGAYETVDAVPGDFLRDGNCILVHEQYFIDRDSLAANRDANFSILSVRGV